MFPQRDGKGYDIIMNRRNAIQTAVLNAKPEDVILISGKGHETYQDINGVKHPFDDKQVIAAVYKELEAHASVN